MEYVSEVRQRFFAPARTGDISPGSGDVVEGIAEDASLSVWVRFQVRLRDSMIDCVRFRVFGCPHTIAAADRIAEDLEGQSIDALGSVDFGAVSRDLGLPREKFGKLLCLEDALSACRKQAAGW